MIPTYNPRADYLKQTLESVLMQDQDADRLQIEVVDDCSPEVDVEQMVRSIVRDRVSFSRNPTNLGLARCWNRCIEQSKGIWVHILHQDDWVLPGFYERLGALAESNKESSLIATRSFVVDKDGVIEGVSPRIRALERAGKDVSTLLYDNSFLFPGVAVRRDFYESYGGFRVDLSYTLDWEFWMRAIWNCGGVVAAEILACYRNASGNETERATRSAEALMDHVRLNNIFADRYPDFDLGKARKHLRTLAVLQAKRYAEQGDYEAERANIEFWRKNSTAGERLRNALGRVLWTVAG